jgi:Cu/Ag efflux pump CusA
VLGQATQPLSQLWKVHLAVLESKIGEEIARESLRQQRQDTAHSVRDLYYQIAQTGALICLAIMGSPFGFMAFLGIASLIGVIVSHVIVLFDFIEEMHEKGEPFEQAIRNAGIERLRPVLTTVCATILALFPLTSHGGPLWKPLCYAQIGGLAVATFITLLLVPVLYSIAVLDLRIVKWETKPKETL